MLGVQIKKKPGSSITTTFYPWKMTNLNITQRETQKVGFSIMIERCSLDSQHGGIYRHPANVGCSFFSERSNHSNQRLLHRKWTREDNKLALYCYLGVTLHKEDIEK